MRLSQRAYRWLLLAYPISYRARYAEPMEQLFRDKLREAVNTSALGRLWASTLMDLAVAVPRVHRDRLKTCLVHHGWRAPNKDGRRCVTFALYEAHSFSSPEITPEHLLLGVLRQEPSLVPVASLVSIRNEIEPGRTARPVEPVMTPKDLPLSRAAIRAWEAAKEIAGTAGRAEATPRDLASGILREPDTLAAQLLRRHLPKQDRISTSPPA